jgi:head-tail adaptor
MIGALRNEIDLLTLNETPDEAGGRARQWTRAATLWAAVDELSAVGVIVGDRGQRIRRIMALVRSRPGLAIGARVQHGGVDFEIVSIESDDERGRRVFLICEEVVK